jgi:hypothetical protein
VRTRTDTDATIEFVVIELNRNRSDYSIINEWKHWDNYKKQNLRALSHVWRNNAQDCV